MLGQFKRKTIRRHSGTHDNKCAMIEAAVAERCAQIRTLYRLLGDLRKRAAGTETESTHAVFEVADAQEYAALESVLNDPSDHIPALGVVTEAAPQQRPALSGASCRPPLVIPLNRVENVIKAIRARIDAFHQRNREDWERYRLLGSAHHLIGESSPSLLHAN